jgi:diguanylate cyclase (GGDEF)-like protein/PAS domain S-box-containing protein
MAAEIRSSALQVPEVFSDLQSSDLLTRLRLLESVVINAHDAVLITAAEPVDSPGPVIQYANPAFTRMTGYTAAEVLGQSPRILQGPLSNVEATGRIRRALKSWEPIEIEVLNYRKDGSTFWVELSITPVCDENGWYTHWISIQRDISERKLSEDAANLLQLTTLQNRDLTEQIRERKLVEATLSQFAFHDSLTGIRNRIFFTDILATALKRTQSSRDYQAVVIFLDLDNFKVINDTLGHRTGDLFLIEIARRLKACARVQDTVARLGGDEFTLLLDSLHSVKDAFEIVERIQLAIEVPVTLSGVNLEVCASIGLCDVSPSYADAEDIMRDADTAMYRAKRQGGSQYVVFEESMHESALTVLRTTSEMRVALQKRQFELHYQPLVHTRDAAVYGLEALIRWNHPVRGSLGPGDFISLAEEVGLIPEIGKWVIRQAIADLQILQQSYARRLLLSVNVSSRQLESSSFLEELSGILAETSFVPEMLQLEITESIFLKDADRIGNLFRSIREMGVKIAFDDFGTGYSSISYLERYPVDVLKIDQWFIRNLSAGLTNSGVVEMMVRLAGLFGMKAAAEGVENEAEAAILVEAGCSFAQGYLYGRPMPMREVSQLLQSH